MPAADVRPLEPDDLHAAWRLGKEAFAGRAAEPPRWALEPAPGLTRWGAFDARGRLVGKAVDLHQERWWGGRAVRAADVGGVAVAPEARGQGVGRALLTALLAGARERGVATSALFPTTAGPYRALGWEVAGDLTTLDLPTADLPVLAPRTTLRGGTEEDLPAAQDAYAAGARATDGLLTAFAPRGAALDDADGLTLVEDAGRVVAWALWSREGGYGPGGVLAVQDLAAATPAGADGLVALLRGWASVAPTVRLRAVPGGPLAARLPVERARVHERETWMLRAVDLVRAVEDRGWPTAVAGRLVLRVEDPAAPWNTGTWELAVEGGRGALRPTDAPPAAALGPRALALLLSGSASGAAVALAGLADVGSDPSVLDLLAAGGPLRLLDSF
ncbi:GNAT family N-acetyltransferase [Vallicoccus soli]|uniref:GNAT family N-acetyltransferase n=1 Tax=Vallicoccus soli TaxID=2339232 RepID=A0A3A3ZLC1_9ACTN|nr:GNAT family N-acetyltransferase [Vallicoccus soli]RJK96986.1 GNAT family N-acetyltransferase [Vallicoccus soli]